MDKTAQVQNEYRKLRRLYKSLPANQLRLVDPLIQNAAFLQVTLAELQTQINAEGYTDEYQNGREQSGRKASATLQSYTAACKQYTAIIDRLTKLLPPAQTKSKLDAFLDGTTGGDADA